MLALTLVGGWSSSSWGQPDNGGLGPMSIRNQFPVALAHLNYTPDSAVTLPENTFRFRYQYALTNTFINTQSPKANTTPVIDNSVIRNAGGVLDASHFPATGYALYIDMEARNHLLRFEYGVFDTLELGLELAWVSFGGGTLDNKIENVERFFGGLNEDRLSSERDRYDFYVIRDGTFLRKSTDAFSNEPLDPVINLKWMLSDGGNVLPAMSVKLSYKAPLDSHPKGNRVHISSGESDYGYYFLFSKAIGDVVAHMQLGTTRLKVADNTLADRLKHKMYGLEFRVDGDNSLIIESVTQSSIFEKVDDPNSIDFPISRQTDSGIMGYKHKSDGFLFELGIIEDYNQQRNEADITVYFELGWEW